MRAMLLLLMLGLSACGEHRPPAPDAADNAQLDEAGNMLDTLANEGDNAV